MKNKINLFGIIAIVAVIALAGCGNPAPDKTYTVTFDADNGSQPTTQTVTEGGTATKPPDPEKNDYDFVHWFNTADNAEWDFNTTVTANITIKAKWTISIHTPTAADFSISGIGTFVFDGDYKTVTVTPREGKSTGDITVYYTGIGETEWSEDYDFPMFIGRYSVTFDVAEAERWNGINGLPAGTIIINDGTPTVPTGVNVSIASANSIRVSWTSVATATSYNVYYIGEDDDDIIKAGTAMGTTSYIHTDLTADTVYWYYVTAVNNYGESDFSAYKAIVICEPDTPNAVDATATGSNTMTVRWSSVTGASSYKIYRATSQDGVKTEVSNSATSTSYSVSGLTANTTYYFFVKAVNGLGESDFSPPSDPAKTLEGSVWYAGLTGEWNQGTTSQSISLRWNRYSTSRNYQYSVYYTTDSPSNTKQLVSSYSTLYLFLHTNVSPNTTYYYWIMLGYEPPSGYYISDQGFSEMITVRTGSPLPPPPPLPPTPPIITIPSTPPSGGSTGSMLCTKCAGDGKCSYNTIAFGRCLNGYSSSTGKKCGVCGGTGKCSLCKGAGRR